MKDEKIFSHLTSTYGIAGNVIFKISQDEKNNYWICTGSGVSFIKDYDSTKKRIAKCKNINSDNSFL